MFMTLQQVFMSNMRKYRKLAGLTQEKLAEICDTDSCYVRQIETGRRFPSLAYIERIAGALEVAPHRLFYDEAAQTGAVLPSVQKAKIKALLGESVSKIYALLDE
jgi:transcriptional regulator with XRE-family HTH domain